MWQITVKDGFLQAAYIGAITVDLVYFTSWKNDEHSPKTLETNYLDLFILKTLVFLKGFDANVWNCFMVKNYENRFSFVIRKVNNLKKIYMHFFFKIYFCILLSFIRLSLVFQIKKALFKTFALRDNHNVLQLLQFIASYLPHPGAETGACPVWLLAGPCCFRLV